MASKMNLTAGNVKFIAGIVKPFADNAKLLVSSRAIKGYLCPSACDGMP